MTLRREDVLTLKTLSNAKSATRRRAMLDNDRTQRLLREVAYNVLKGHVPLSPAQLRKLKRYKAGVRLLSCKGTSLRKRLALTQNGGFLSALLTPLLGTVLGSVANRLFSS